MEIARTSRAMTFHSEALKYLTALPVHAAKTTDHYIQHAQSRNPRYALCVSDANSYEDETHRNPNPPRNNLS